ncbi:MAG: glycerol-3-phosphate responsive antiterminator, partial [Clostridia bacterium]|nr:glycerol-3-phosphate responsive antiterminator [Clostridia bacterium]
MDIQNIADCPTLPAVKNRQQLERALKTDNEVIFLLFGDILSVAELT